MILSDCRTMVHASLKRLPMLPLLVEALSGFCLLSVIDLGLAYYFRTRHMPLSRRAEDRRARIYVILMAGVTVIGLSVRLAFELGVRPLR
jgi:hypothetical protein